MVALRGAVYAVVGFKFYESKDFVCKTVLVLGEVIAYELLYRLPRFP